MATVESFTELMNLLVNDFKSLIRAYSSEDKDAFCDILTKISDEQEEKGNIGLTMHIRYAVHKLRNKN